MGSRLNRKTTVEECNKFSISSLTRDGFFRALPTTRWNSTWKGTRMRGILSIYFFWHMDEDGRSFLRITDGKYGVMSIARETVEIVQTRLIHGQRRWFRCPGLGGEVPCYRRVGFLYLPPNQHRFACRKCHDLTYESVQRHDARLDRLAKLSAVEFLRNLATGTFRQQLQAVSASGAFLRNQAKLLPARGK